MPAAIHYLVKGNLIRNKEGQEVEFFSINQEFYNDSPIIARKEAFRFYQSYIDILLQAKHTTYTNDLEARDLLLSYVDTGITKTEHDEFGTFVIEGSYGNGIGVYMIVDQPKDVESWDTKDEPGTEFAIHGIGHDFDFNYSYDFLAFDLEQELSYYRFYNYPEVGFTKKITYCNRSEWEEGFKENEPTTFEILDTPFSWREFDKAYWWDPKEGERQLQLAELEERIETEIAEGENNYREFKPALLFNFKTSQAGIGVKAIIAKAIVAFLNAHGGLLFIGVQDDGTVTGLDHDFSLAGEKDPHDFFRLEFDNMLSHFLSFSVKNNVNGFFQVVNDKQIFIVQVSASRSRPVFLNGQHVKEFYVRGEASSSQLNDPEEIVRYCLEKWGRGDDE